jgi:hypothetical protein
MSFDRVRETSTTTGTGNIALGGAPLGFRTFASVYTPGGGVTLQYVVEGVDGTGALTGEWEVGQGVIVAGPALQRVSVTASSNSGSLVAFTSAELRVYDGVTVDAVTDIANVRAAAAISALGLGTAATADVGDFDAAGTAAALVAAIELPHRVSVVVDFGANFTDRADAVVTGLSWVTTSHVLTPVLRPSAGVDADEIRLLEMSPTITDVIDGVGFTLVVTTTPEARGQYTFLVTGV